MQNSGSGSDWSSTSPSRNTRSKHLPANPKAHRRPHAPRLIYCPSTYVYEMSIGGDGCDSGMTHGCLQGLCVPKPESYVALIAWFDEYENVQREMTGVTSGVNPALRATAHDATF